MGLRNISGIDWFLSFDAYPLVSGLVVELIVFHLHRGIALAAIFLVLLHVGCKSRAKIEIGFERFLSTWSET